MSIVTVNVTQTVGSIPTTLQKSGAFISQGGTTTTTGTSTLITQLSDLTAILKTAAALTSAVLTSGTVTATTTSAHGLPVGDTMYLTVAGVIPTGYNGTFLCSITSATQFTYSLSGTLAAGTGGTYIPQSVTEITAMANTFFAQGSSLSVYVLELGPGSVNTGVAALSSYLTNNPNSNYVPGAVGYYYAYVVPKSWDGNSNFLTLMSSYQSTTSRLYFFITTTLATYSLYTNLMKCAFTLIESPNYGVYPANAITSITYSGGYVTATTTTAHGVVPGNWVTISGCSPIGYNGTFLALAGTSGTTIVYAVSSNPGVSSSLGTLVASLYSNAGVPVTENSVTSAFWRFLNYSPSASNLVTPFAYGYTFGVTPFPTRGTYSLISVLKAANTNIIGTGAEGGISNTIIMWGTSEDGHDLTYWYSVDYVQITVDRDLANAVINGSNNSANPLYYDQNGINRLQAVAQKTMRTAISFGLALSPVTVYAIPFVDYVTANPSDYTSGVYGGMSVTYTPQRGFTSIVFNVNVSSFPSAS